MVLHALNTHPQGETYSAEICRLTGLPSGTVVPILQRLEQAGVLTSRREDVDPRKEGRPRRRYYTLTEAGKLAADAERHTDA